MPSDSDTPGKEAGCKEVGQQRKRQPKRMCFLTLVNRYTHLLALSPQALLMLGKTLVAGKWLSSRMEVAAMSCGDTHAVVLTKVLYRPLFSCCPQPTLLLCARSWPWTYMYARVYTDELRTLT